MNRANSALYALAAALSLGACSGDYCADYQSVATLMTNKLAPCTDAGFLAGFNQSSCESVLNGGNCSSGDRNALASVGSAGVTCANENPVCDPATPLDAVSLQLQYLECFGDAGPPASSVSAACSSALTSVSAGF